MSARGGPSTGGASAASRLWGRFRGLPAWLQVAAWVLVVVVAGSAAGAGDGTDRSALDTVAASAAAQADAAERAAEAEARAARAEDGAQAAEAEAAATSTTGWTVTYVVDGDTVDVRHTDGTEERVRIVGIDTPERGECGFSEASVAMTALVQDATVDLVAGARDDRDRYGRILRYVDVDGIDAGLTLIEDGLAIARYDSRDGYGRHDREDAYATADAATPHACGGAQAPATAPAAPVPGTSTTGPGSGPNGAWKNCTEAREHGAAPVLRGDPGYGSHLDRDDDGIGCE